MSPATKRAAVIGAVIAGALASGLCVAHARADGVQVDGDPTPGEARIIAQAEGRFTPSELALVQAIVIADADGSLPTPWPEGWRLVGGDAVCGEAWSVQRIVVMRATASCFSVPNITHELCHFVAYAAGDDGHGELWTSCMRAHGEVA